MSRPSRHTDPCASALGGRSAERSCATPAGCGLSKLGLPVERSKDIRLSSISDSCPFWFGVGFCERPRGRSKRIFAETSSLYSIRNSYIYIYIYMLNGVPYLVLDFPVRAVAATDCLRLTQGHTLIFPAWQIDACTTDIINSMTSFSLMLQLE